MEAETAAAPVPFGAVVCAWCRGIIRPGDPSALVSHGICPECQAREFPGLRIVEVVH